MYIGQMSLWFRNAGKLTGMDNEADLAELYDNQTMIFGFIQILCVVWAAPIG